VTRPGDEGRAEAGRDLPPRARRGLTFADGREADAADEADGVRGDEAAPADGRSPAGSAACRDGAWLEQAEASAARQVTAVIAARPRHLRHGRGGYTGNRRRPRSCDAPRASAEMIVVLLTAGRYPVGLDHAGHAGRARLAQRALPAAGQAESRVRPILGQAGYRSGRPGAISR
jgi:hypothetical protein